MSLPFFAKSSTISLLLMKLTLNNMEITWHGETCFTIKGKKTSIVIDPYEGGKHQLKSVKASTVLSTNDYDEKAKYIEGVDEAELINWPGEFEIQGAAIVSIPVYTDEHEEGNTEKGRIMAFSIMVDDIRICHLGTIGERLDDETLGKIGNIDVLIIPIAGKNCLDAKKAHKIAEEIEPRIIIPMNYSGAELDPMLKEMAVTDPEKLEKFEISSRSQLPEEQTDFVVLTESP